MPLNKGMPCGIVEKSELKLCDLLHLYHSIVSLDVSQKKQHQNKKPLQVIWGFAPGIVGCIRRYNISTHKYVVIFLSPAIMPETFVGT